MSLKPSVKSVVNPDDDSAAIKELNVKDFTVTASVFSTEKQKKMMLSLDKYKMRETGLMKNLQDMVFVQKVDEFKKIVDECN